MKKLTLIIAVVLLGFALNISGQSTINRQIENERGVLRNVKIITNVPDYDKYLKLTVKNYLKYHYYDFENGEKINITKTLNVVEYDTVMSQRVWENPNLKQYSYHYYETNTKYKYKQYNWMEYSPIKYIPLVFIVRDSVSGTVVNKLISLKQTGLINSVVVSFSYLDNTFWNQYINYYDIPSNKQIKQINDSLIEKSKFISLIYKNKFLNDSIKFTFDVMKDNDNYHHSFISDSVNYYSSFRNDSINYYKSFVSDSVSISEKNRTTQNDIKTTQKAGKRKLKKDGIILLIMLPITLVTSYLSVKQ